MRIWWCQEHGDTGNEQRCMWGNWDRHDDDPCRMVKGSLILDALSVREAPEVDKNQMGMW